MSYWKEPSECLIALKDVEIVAIECDHHYSSGYCDTCDIGESFINEVNFTTKDGDEFTVCFVGDFDYMISEAKLIRVLLANLDKFEEMTFDEFKQFMRNVSEFLGEKEMQFLELIRNYGDE